MAQIDFDVEDYIDECSIEAMLYELSKRGLSVLNEEIIAESDMDDTARWGLIRMILDARPWYTKEDVKRLFNELYDSI